MPNIFCNILVYFCIILERDSKVIISALKSEDQSFASFGHLIAGVEAHAESFHSFSFSYIHRQENFVIHNLARHVRHVSSLPVWMKDVPS